MTDSEMEPAEAYDQLIHLAILEELKKIVSRLDKPLETKEAYRNHGGPR